MLSVHLPPLREREGDMALIMQHYLTYYAHKFGKKQIRLSLQAADRIAAYAWPGNIREIRNISEQLAVLCENDTINVTDVEAVLPMMGRGGKQLALVAVNGGDSSLSQLNKQQIIDVLAHSASRKEAAKILGISKSTLWRKCKEFGLS